MATRHRATDSDHISSIAAEEGITLWQTVWLSEENAALRSERANPNLLFKGDRAARGDVVSVPTRTRRNESASSGEPSRFRIAGRSLFLRLRILDASFGAIADADYQLTIDGVAEPRRGKTDANGQIEEPIPPDTQTAILGVRVPADTADESTDATPAAPAEDGAAAPAPAGDLQGDLPISWTLQIGALNPINERAPDARCISGVQARLNNLALDSGPVDGILGANTTAAVRAFQGIYGLPRDGDPGSAAFQSKLASVHDTPDSIVPPPETDTAT